MKTIKVQNISSTNTYASELLINNKIKEETVIYTNYQNKGRGLGNNCWYSEDNKNILASLVIFPNIKSEEHFKLNMLISLSICNYLIKKGVEASIKWPNDIYVKDDKIAGILVENHLYGNTIKTSIIGIGLNLNQTKFPNNIQNPISLKNITHKNYNIKTEIDELFSLINNNISNSKNKTFEDLKPIYIENLYKFKQETMFKREGNVFKATISDIEKDGHLLIINTKGETTKHYFKEIEYVLDKKYY